MIVMPEIIKSQLTPTVVSVIAGREKILNDSVKVVIILQMGFIETNQKQIVKIPRLSFKLGNNGDLQLSLSRELIA